VLDAFQELIDELLAAPGHLRDLDAGGTDNEEARALLALLTARDAAVLQRVQTTIRQTTPLLKAVPETAPADGSSADLMAAFESGRGELVSLLMNLTLKDWERAAIDESGSEITVADDVETHVEFDERAQEQLARLLGS
jgi:hypothetical protein